jgi:hypothetical protein
MYYYSFCSFFFTAYGLEFDTGRYFGRCEHRCWVEFYDTYEIPRS